MDKTSGSDFSSLLNQEDSESDSDLQVSQKDLFVGQSSETQKSASQDHRESSPDLFIGGANVVRASKTRPSLYRGKSIYDEDQNEDESVEEERIDSSSQLSSYVSTEDISLVDEKKDEKRKRETHKIFTFSLPFGGKSILPTASLSTIFSSVLPGESEIQDETIERNKLKEKLKRSDSITSLEERALFKDTKGIDNVRKRAFRKTFELESLKQTIKNITSSTGELTSDGYDLARLESIWNEIEGDFLVMGGYRGSVLRDSVTNRRVWIPIRAGLNIRKIDLRIGPTDEDEMKAQKLIKPDGMLTHIGPVDVSRRLMRRLKSNPKVKVENYGYDWRLSLDLSAENLRQKLQEIYDRQKVKKGTFIFAHSMGGLVAHKVLQNHTHLIRGIVYVGSPSECPNILGPLKFGDEVLMNKTILSKEANFFMRSSFYFLPTKGHCFVNKDTFKKYKLDFFDPSVWVKLGLSPVVDEDRKKLEKRRLKNNGKQSTEISQEKKMAKTDVKEKPPQPGISTDIKDLLDFLNPVPILRSLSGQNGQTSEVTKPLKLLNPTPLISKISSTATDLIDLKDGKQSQEDEEEISFRTPYDDSLYYLERTLRRAKAYIESLDHVEGKQYPPLIIVYSKSVPTVRGVKISSLSDIKNGNYNDFYYGPGDGVVHHKWLLPEQKGFPVAAKIDSSCGHVSLLSDLDAMAKALVSLVDEEKKQKTDSLCI